MYAIWKFGETHEESRKEEKANCCSKVIYNVNLETELYEYS